MFRESVRQCAVKIFTESLVIKGDDLEYEVRKALLETKKPKGIYFLLSGDEKLLYVGKSENLLDRLINHVTGKGGNSNKYIYLVKEIRVAIFEDGSGKRLTQLEKTFIAKMKPAFNGGNYTAGSSMQFGYESLYPKIKNASLEEMSEMLKEWPKIEVA
jgi:predicted GIY-YIG superfamily endonuclease